MFYYVRQPCRLATSYVFDLRPDAQHDLCRDRFGYKCGGNNYDIGVVRHTGVSSRRCFESDHYSKWIRLECFMDGHHGPYVHSLELQRGSQRCDGLTGGLLLYIAKRTNCNTANDMQTDHVRPVVHRPTFNFLSLHDVGGASDSNFRFSNVDGRSYPRPVDATGRSR